MHTHAHTCTHMHTWEICLSDETPGTSSTHAEVPETWAVLRPEPVY